MGADSQSFLSCACPVSCAFSAARMTTPGRGGRALIPEHKTLLRAAFAPGTFDKYERAVRDFCVFCERMDLPVNTLPELDSALYRYFEFLYGLGYSPAVGSAALHGLMVILPHYKRQCHEAMMALRGWGRLVPTVSHPPLTWPLAVLIAVRLRLMHCRTLSVAVLVQFDALLRIGELLQLRREDVCDSRDSRLGLASAAAAPSAAASASASALAPASSAHAAGVVSEDFVSLRIRAAKTGKNQSAYITDPHALAVFRQHLRSVRAGQFVFQCKPARMSRMWLEATAALGLSREYTSHSLRHGGATRLFLAGHSMETVMARGRWASSSSARVYLNSSTALLVAQSAPAHVQSAADLLSADVCTSFAVVDRVLREQGSDGMSW